MSEELQDTDNNFEETPFVEKYYFSLSVKGFYLLSSMPLYENKPDDLTEMLSEDYDRYWNPPDGYYQVFDDEGPRLEKIPDPDYVAQAEAQRDVLLAEANSATYSLNLKLMMGRKLTESEASKVNAWLDYIDVLNDTDLSDAPDVQWPTRPSE
ncbi:tail fiber assembly protein [Pantoea sp. LMR881]|uniref:tail fiber assembly protein n=1 Tax=Pantoea sp. LMR881 TaxID=3014336 RepID=UPI0022B03F05|nr:tail fiber assembly protein [Pantoea sp. LMR881]MCZ4058232.1 tail fiber assembly protein [Pantoea sp. LMR881]